MLTDAVTSIHANDVSEIVGQRTQRSRLLSCKPRNMRACPSHPPSSQAGPQSETLAGRWSTRSPDRVRSQSSRSRLLVCLHVLPANEGKYVRIDDLGMCLTQAVRQVLVG